jgi:hypothetical protein
MFKRLFIGDHDSIARGLNNISLIHQNLGEYEKALKYAQDSLDMRMRLFKGDHPHIISVKSNILEIALRLQDIESDDDLV